MQYIAGVLEENGLPSSDHVISDHCDHLVVGGVCAPTSHLSGIKLALGSCQSLHHDNVMPIGGNVEPMNRGDHVALGGCVIHAFHGYWVGTGLARACVSRWVGLRRDAQGVAQGVAQVEKFAQGACAGLRNQT